MRFLQLEAIHFGPLQNRRWELEAGVFVVFGPNEAGKSSFHAALRSTLYGFERAKRSDHPLARLNAGNENLEIKATLALDDGRPLHVHRTLMSYGKLVVTDDEGNELFASQKNESLPAIQSIPGSLFDAVYSLTANDTTMQTDDVHDHIQELLLGETGLRGARPIGEVRKELLQDTQALWRADGLGKTQAKQLQSELDRARKAFRDQKKVDRELREARAERDALAPEIEKLEAFQKRLQRRMDWSRYANRWKQYRARRAELDSVAERMAALPPEVRAVVITDPDALRQQIARRRDSLAPHLELVQTDIPEPSAQALVWQEHAAEIEALLDGLEEYRLLQKESEQAEGDVEREKALVSQSMTQLGVPSRLGKALVHIPCAELAAAAHQWELDLQAHAERAQSKEVSPLWILWASIGLVCAVGWVLVPAGQFGWLAGLVVSMALCVVTLLRPSRPAQIEPAPAIPAAWAAALDSIGLDPGRYRSPAALMQIGPEIQRYQERLGQAQRFHQHWKKCQTRLQQQVEQWQPLLDTLGLQGPPEQWGPWLKSQWKTVQATLSEWRQKTKERQHSQRIVDSLQQELQDLEQHQSALSEYLRAVFPEAALQSEAFEASKRYAVQTVACDTELKELRSDRLYNEEWEASGNPPGEGADEEFEGPPLEATPEEWQAALEEVQRELKKRSEVLGSLDEKLRVNDRAQLAQTVEWRQEIEAKQQENYEERDRLALLGNLLERAERQHREAHQPDVLAKAGDYLERITAGRYTALKYPEDSLDNERPPLQVKSRDHGWCDVGPPLSRGTQEQVYLALRLGTLDFLDEGREKLPMVLDEALVHWDFDRRRSLYGVLKQLCKHRQVILFTCHESFAREVQTDLDARLIELPRNTPEEEPIRERS